MAKVFVDSSGWYALIDRNDQWHKRAVEELQRTLKAGTPLVTSDYIVDESCTLAKARAGPLAAANLLDLLHETQMLEWEWIGADRFERAEKFFRKQHDQGYSFTDCTSFVLMRELRLESALTSDAHFTSAGFRALLVKKPPERRRPLSV
jgi:predicted nucleic acid-binding protein